MARRSKIDKRIEKFSDGSSQSYGEVLRKNREKHGISLTEVAKDLHIREDILLALENEDFSKIPPQGYSRNMIKSYSRLLGLNANKITEMFLDADYSYKLSKKRKSMQEISIENKKRIPNNQETLPRSKTPREQLAQKRNDKDNNNNQEDDSFLMSGNRKLHMYGKKYSNTPRARKDLDATEEIQRGKRKNFNSNSRENRDLFGGDSYSDAKARIEARRKQKLADGGFSKGEDNPYSEDARQKKAVFSGRKKIDRNAARTFTDEENPNFNPNAATNNKSYQFMNVYQKKNSSMQQSRLMIPAIVGVVLVLIIVLILVFFFVGKKQENDKTDVSNLNVVGISDIENPNKEENEEGQAQVQAEEPKDVEFKYKVKDGMSVYMEIYENNGTRPTLAREVKSGETNVFKVTDTLKFVTSKPDGVEIYVANELVVPTDEKGNGVYNYTVDFKKYLAQ